MGADKIYVHRLMKAVCNCGTMPNYLNVKKDHGIVWERGGEPGKYCEDKQPFMNACDFKEGDNIVHFGRCNSNINPGNMLDMEEAVMGVLIPGSTFIKKLIGCEGCKCKPILIDIWESVDDTHLIGGVPALTQNSTLFCRNGGSITICLEEKEGE